MNEETILSSHNIEWSLWEIYRVGAAIKDWESSIKKLIKIQTLKDFYELALFLPHLQPSKLFFDKETRSKTKYKIKLENKDEFVHIDSICMFRGEIPPLTESNKNKNGGAHYYIFYDMKTAQMDQLWLSLTTSLVTNDGIANAEIINGLRFCDKSKPKDNATQCRLEIWTESDYYKPENLEHHNKSKLDIEKIIRESGLDVKHSYKAHNGQE